MNPAHTASAWAPAVSEAGASVLSSYPALAGASIVCAVIAAGILLWFLFRRPLLTGQVKILLLLGIGVFPIGSAMTGNIAGFEHTKRRNFCGSCHVMTPFQRDVENPNSHSLAAIHGRNETFGEDNCYECHRTYGAFSTVLTKLGGMRHVYEYYTRYQFMDVNTALSEIALYEPMPNAICISCHSTTARTWLAWGDHRSSLPGLRNGHISCVSHGCHGPAHPFAHPKNAPPAPGPGASP